MGVLDTDFNVGGEPILQGQRVHTSSRSVWIERRGCYARRHGAVAHWWRRSITGGHAWWRVERNTRAGAGRWGISTRTRRCLVAGWTGTRLVRRVRVVGAVWSAGCVWGVRSLWCVGVVGGAGRGRVVGRWRWRLVEVVVKVVGTCRCVGNRWIPGTTLTRRARTVVRRGHATVMGRARTIVLRSLRSVHRRSRASSVHRRIASLGVRRCLRVSRQSSSLGRTADHCNASPVYWHSLTLGM